MFVAYIFFVLIFVWLNIVSGQTSFRPNIRLILCLSVICISVICPSAFCLFGWMSFGRMSFQSHVFWPSVRSVFCLSAICPTTIFGKWSIFTTCETLVLISRDRREHMLKLVQFYELPWPNIFQVPKMAVFLIFKTTVNFHRAWC